MKLDPSMINVTRAGVKPAEATLTDGGLLLEWPDGTTVLIPKSALLIEEGEILLKDSSGNVEVTEPGKTTVTTDWETACLEVRGDGIEDPMTVIGQIDQAFLFQAHWEDSPLPFAPLPRFEPPTYEELEIPESRLRQNNKPTIGNLTLRVSDEGLPFGKPDNFGFDDFTNSVIASGYIQVDDLNGDPLTFSLNPLANAGLTSGGVAIVWSNSGSQKVIGTANGNVIFTVTVDNRGFVQVVQSGPLDHPDPTREDELPFQVQVVVSDGPTSATGTLTVVVEDDSPMIKMGGYEKVDEDWIRCEKPHHDEGDNDEDGPISDLRMGGGGPPQWGDDEGCGDEAHVCHPGNRDRDSKWHVEDGDDRGGNMAKGNLGFWFGADGPAPEVPEYEGGPTDLVVSMNALALARDPKGAPVPVTSGGQTVHTIWDPATDTLTGYIGDVVTDPGDISSGNLIFTLEFGPEGVRGGPTGEYKFTLHGPLDHPSQNDGNYKNGKEDAWEDNLILQFEATITDGDGDQATQPFYIDVDDDKPTLKWDMVKVDEDWIKCDRDDDCDHDKKSERCDDPQDNMVTALRSGGGQGQGGHHHHGDDKSCYPGNQDKGYAPGDDRGWAVARGDMNFRFGADGPAADRPGWGSRDVDLVVKMHRKAERDDPDPQGHHHDEVRVTSGGKEVKTSWDHEADVLTGYIEERDHKGRVEQKVIFTLDFDPDGDDELTGNFKFTLLGPLDHPSQEAGRGNPGSNRGGGSNGGHDEPDGGYEDNLILKFDVTITDGDGDSVTQTLKVNVDDDMPTMKWDYVKVDEDCISCGKDQGCDDRDEPRPGDERSHQDNCERDDFEVAALSQGGNRRPGENEEGGRPPHHGDDKDCDPGNQDRAPGDDYGGAVARGDMKFRFGADGPAADKPGGGSRDVDLVVRMHHKAERDDPDPQGQNHDEVRVTSGGKEVKTSWDHEADVLTGYIEERDHKGRVEQKVIFTLDFDPDGDDELTGNFKFTLLGPLDHPSQEAGRGNPGSNRGGGSNGGHDEPDGGYEDNLILKFDVTITDGDGDSVTQTLKVNVDDDMPTMKWDYVKVDEDCISCGKDQGCDDRDEPRPGDERSHQDNCERDDFEVAALSQGGNRRPGENEGGGRPPQPGDDKDCDPGNRDHAPGDDEGCAVARGDMNFRFGADGPAADRPGGGSRDVDLVVKMHHKAERDDPDPQGHHHDEVRVTSGGKEVKTSWDHEADVLTGYIEERDHKGRVEQKVIFTLDFDPDGDDELTGNFKFTLLGPLDHPSQEAGRGNPGSNRGGGSNGGHDEPDGGYEDNLILKFDVTITDGDGDSVTQTLKVNVDDDMPTVAISRNDQAKFVLDESVGTDGSIKDEGGRSNDDETLQGEDGVIGFSHVRGSSLFTEQVDAGADGLESKVYKLTLAPGNPDSGLVDAVSDEKVILFIYNNGDIVGRTENSGELVFRVHVNEENGSVTVKQFRAVEHDDPDDHDENQQSAAHLNAELIGLQVTVTDGDGDSASDQIEIGRYIRFEDDGPAVEIVRKASAKFVLDESVGTDGSIKDEGGRSNDDETLQGEDGVIGFSHVRGSSLFTEQVDAGADGLESKVYKLTLAPGNPDSGLVDAVSDEKVILFIYNNGDIVGRTENSGELVFRVHVNEGNGSVTVKQFRAVEHDDPNDHDENQQSAAHLNAELIGLQVTVTDGDGDSASDQIEIGRYIRFEDDGPSEIFPDSVSVLNQGGQCVFGNLDGVISMGGDGVVLDNVGSDKDGVVRFANIGDGDVSDFTTGGEAVYYFVSDDMQRLIATTSSSEEDVVTDESSQNFNVVFTIELQPDGRLDEYKVTTFAEIDSGGGSETISYELGSGNSDFFIEGESLPGGSGTEILITGNGSVNLASDIGINDQWIDPVLSRGQTTLPADYARIDFGLFSEDSNNDFVIDQHISINEVSFKVAQTGANALNQVDVEVRAFAANDNNDFTDDSQVEISQVKVFSASGMLIEDVDAGSVSNYVTFDADGDGSVIVKNALQGYRIVIFTVGGLNRIEVENSTVNAQANDQFTIDSISYVSEDVAQDVLDSFDIVLVDSDGDTTETSQFSVSFTSAISPVTLDLDGDGLEFIPLSEQLMFDFDGDGNLDQSAWVGPDDALLAIDLNGDGLVNDGSEVVFTQHAEGAETDLEGLALAYDSNHDGKLDANDDEFSLFGVWQDKNSNGINEEGEFMSLEEAGIVSIDLSGDGNAYTAAEGDVYIYGESSFTKADGETGAVGDAAFAVEYGSGEEMPDLSELLSDSDDAMDALLDSFGSDAPGEDGGSESSGSFSELDTSGDSPTSAAFEGLDEAVVAVDPLPAPEVIMDAPVAV
ncbi:MAG: DUF5801 repeats-in-toxin domain-containing protein [Verrucomicrobiales bacterium]|nr:DUF5801 repeats-in-toxin domain-containing protein [Verrucomicrobiales bacterium]